MYIHRAVQDLLHALHEFGGVFGSVLFPDSLELTEFSVS